jgi:hypothetical protein
VLASGLIGDPGVEIRMARVRVIVFVILAVIPVVPLVRLAVWGLPRVVDMDVVPLLAVGPLLLVFGIPLITPLSVRGLLVAVVLGAIRFAVLEVRSGVVVLGVLIALTRTRLPGQHRRSHKHHCGKQPQKQHQLSQLILLPKTSVPTISLRLAKNPPFRIRARLLSSALSRSTKAAYSCVKEVYVRQSTKRAENLLRTPFYSEPADA